MTVTTSRRFATAACTLLFASTLLATGALFFAPVAAIADERESHPYALIFGTVWGADHHPAYGVPIKIRRTDQKKAKWQLMSDHRGEFAQRLPAGKAEYIVWADIKVARGKEQPQVLVKVENEERHDIDLHLTE